MKQFFRHFRKQKVVGLLNICSLSLGIMVSVIVGLWAINELSFDSFHEDGDRMYRVVQSFELSGKPLVAATSFKPLGEIAAAEMPEIEHMCRIYKENDGVTIEEEVTFGLTAIMTDYDFFSFFTFPMKVGDPKTAFSAPDNVILTESTAKKYFPNADPIGKKISYHGYNFSVSGIMYDIPRNSHIQADIVFPLFGYFGTWEWDSSFSYDTYFIISKGANMSAIEKRLSEINKAGVANFSHNAYNIFHLEPLRDVHFSKTDPGFDNAVKGNKNLLHIFIVIAITILTIACINFTNLFISTSFMRARSIGIKKSQGADKVSLILDFYKETTIYVFIAVILGVLLALLVLPVFNSYTRSDISIDFSSYWFYLFVICLAIVTTFMAGSFPAFQMTRFSVIETLRGRFKGKKMSALQKILIVIQFTASISLLITVIFFARQIDHILSQDLRFDNKNVVYVYGWREFGHDFKALRERMMGCPDIADVAMRQYDVPLRMGNGIGGENIETGDQILMDLSEVSPNYFDFFGMKFVEGENPLTLESAPDLNYCVINERAAEMLGMKEKPIDKSFIFKSIGGGRNDIDGKTFIIKGVIRNTYVKSLYQDTDPEMYLNLSRDDHNPIFFKIGGDTQKALNFIEEEWKKIIPNVPFVYHFLDKTYEAQYASEVNSRNVLSYALIITFLITIAGMYAMVFYSTQRRIKEIGIRKINGATIKDLLLLLNKDIVMWVVISFVIASPLSYLYVNNWLSNFVVRTSLSPWVFLLAGLVSFVVAILTVSYQTWKAANMNPVNAIRSE
ncbi:MAG: FtsX-like permease family protein [Dysgonomonas sp.]|nr:FtsX-like permease family protein [Dysgonomonas sp.]